jgi:hypothetical protein
VVAVVLDPAGRDAAAALRTRRGVGPRLRGDDLSLDASHELLALGHGPAQGGQVGEVVGPGDRHDVAAVFLALGPEITSFTIQATLSPPHRETGLEVSPSHGSSQSSDAGGQVAEPRQLPIERRRQREGGAGHGRREPLQDEV